ncbi:hypothetical protein I4F81_001874 [Pyropia yezoensis]|uniref:Uncharacterized protein n=1 Tax=Pyropia yezoensis TaxID=2788 RepID=A0ACC3BMZ5_PYRYE|nr:hypothetical protein I4F81_001874 [Neopyropia yezoensis]
MPKINRGDEEAALGVATRPEAARREGTASQQRRVAAGKAPEDTIEVMKGRRSAWPRGHRLPGGGGQPASSDALLRESCQKGGGMGIGAGMGIGGGAAQMGRGGGVLCAGGLAPHTRRHRRRQGGGA